MVSVSFMAPGEAARVPPPLLPENATLENYRQLFGTYGALRFLANSLLVSTLATTLALLFTVPAGYAFAKLRFRGRDATFRLLRSEEHTSELQSLMRISYAVFCLKTKIDKSIYRQKRGTTHIQINCTDID